MANVAHSTLTGSELHEPKGAASAALGTVYVADGAGSGNWTSLSTSSFTGMIADFPAIEAPTGWLELDGSVISTSTYPALFSVMAKTSAGTRTNGSAVVTSIADTSKFKAGYYVFGTGIASGTTILTVDSASQITLSGNSSSSGTSSFFVSPWLMNTGTITLPDMTTAGRFRRSQTSSTRVGLTQTDQNQSHTHTISGVPGNGTLAIDAGGVHSHGVTDPTHVHSFTGTNFGGGGSYASGGGFQGGTFNTAAASTGITINNSTSHTHTISGALTAGTLANSSNGGTEARPVALVFLTCVKT